MSQFQFPPPLPEIPRRKHVQCIFCPFNADQRDRRIKALIRGKTFDLRTHDGLFDAVEKLLKCFGGVVISS